MKMIMNGPSRGTAVLAVTTAMIILATLFVFLRMVSRIGIVRRVTLDDYFMILAWCMAMGLSIAICYGTSVGLGMHDTDVPEQWNAPLKISEFAFSVLYNPALMATKTSILLFYLSLSQTNDIFRRATLATLVVVNTAGIALTFLNIFQCTPFSATFATPIPAGAKCLEIVTLYLSSAPVNIITDLIILLLPMPLLTAMRLPRKQKTILVITFGFGFFVAVVDVIRIAYLQGASRYRLEHNASGADQRNNTDLSWYGSLSYMWSAIEVNVGIMCACVPGLKPLVVRFMPYILRDSGDKSYINNESSKSESAEMTHTAPTSPNNSVASPRACHSMSASGVHRGNNNQSIDMMDFLTTPDMSELPQSLQRSKVAENSGIRQRQKSPPTFFDFVTIEKEKSMVKLTNRESWFPILMVTILFFLWGVAYGFLDALNDKFVKIANMEHDAGRTIGMHSTYFGAYFFGPLTIGRFALKHWGFKASFIVGLCIYSCGTLAFWPSAVLTSFPAFIVSNFIVGLGLSTLEIAANPYVALCGPTEYMEARLLLSQAVQAIGSVISPLLAQKVLFKSTQTIGGLVDVQWTYLGIALFTVLMAVAFFYIPLPEATDEELEEVAQRSEIRNFAEIKGVRVVYITLGFAVLAQFCYVGSQESVSTSFNGYILASLRRGVNANDYLTVGRATFSASRFITALLCLFIKPRIILLCAFGGALICSALSMTVSGELGEGMVLTLYFFEGPIFPLIFAITLRGLGRFTKDGSSLLTAAICGGSIFPPIMYAVADAMPDNYQQAYSVIVGTFAVGLIFPLYLNFSPLARLQVDPVKEGDSDACCNGRDSFGELSPRDPKMVTIEKK